MRGRPLCSSLTVSPWRAWQLAASPLRPVSRSRTDADAFAQTRRRHPAWHNFPLRRARQRRTLPTLALHRLEFSSLVCYFLASLGTRTNQSPVGINTVVTAPLATPQTVAIDAAPIDPECFCQAITTILSSSNPYHSPSTIDSSDPTGLSGSRQDLRVVFTLRPSPQESLYCSDYKILLP
jgi:hypothetical protein